MKKIIFGLVMLFATNVFAQTAIQSGSQFTLTKEIELSNINVDAEMVYFSNAASGVKCYMGTKVPANSIYRIKPGALRLHDISGGRLTLMRHGNNTQLELVVSCVDANGFRADMTKEILEERLPLSITIPGQTQYEF